MRETLITLGLAVAIFAGFIVQEFLPPIPASDGARVLLAPVLFCYGACFLPFSSMLVLAVIAGFFSDFTALQVVHRTVEATDLDSIQSMAGTVELSAGWSILLFLAAGLFCQGLRSLVLRGHWWLPPLMSAGTTFVYLGMQFAMLTMRRFDTGGLFWSETVAWRILAPTMVSVVLGLLLVMAGVLISGAAGRDRRVLREY